MSGPAKTTAPKGALPVTGNVVVVPDASGGVLVGEAGDAVAVVGAALRCVQSEGDRSADDDGGSFCSIDVERNPPSYR